VVSEFNKPTGTGSGTEASHGTIALSAYSEANDAARPTSQADAGLITLTGVIPPGNRYGGIQAVVYAATSTYNAETGAGRIAVQDYSGQSEVSLVLGSPSVTRLQVQLIPQGGPFNGCVPTASVAVGTTPQPVTLALDSSVWTVPSHCTAVERELTLGDTLAHLSYVSVGITVAQAANLADGLPRSFTLGEISFSGPQAAPIDYDETVTVYNHPNGAGASLVALHGGLGGDLFSEQSNATASVPVTGDRMARVSVTVPSGNTYGGLMWQSFGPGSTWTPQFGNTAVGTGDIAYSDFSQEQRLRIQVGSTTADKVLVRLTPRGGPFGHCVPSFLLPVTKMTVAHDIALADPAWFVPQNCTEQDRARTPAQVLGDLHMISVGLTEAAVPGIADGQPREFTLGEIDFVR
jgi:hypothetical protein